MNSNLICQFPSQTPLESETSSRAGLLFLLFHPFVLFLVLVTDHVGPGSSGGRTMEMKDTDQSLDREKGGECPQQWDKC